jgi:hypothetical protein
MMVNHPVVRIISVVLRSVTVFRVLPPRVSYDRPPPVLVGMYLLCKVSDLSSFFFLLTIYSSIPFAFSSPKGANQFPPSKSPCSIVCSFFAFWFSRASFSLFLFFFFYTLRRRCSSPPLHSRDHWPDGNTVRTLVLYLNFYHFYFIFYFIGFISPSHFLFFLFYFIFYFYFLVFLKIFLFFLFLCPWSFFYQTLVLFLFPSPFISLLHSPKLRTYTRCSLQPFICCCWIRHRPYPRILVPISRIYWREADFG